MKHFALSGQIRTGAGKADVKAIRKAGLVPCNLYGQGLKNVLFTVNEKELKGVTHTPSSFIVDLSLDNGESYTAVLHELQWHPVTESCLHVDFLKVSEDKPISIEVPVNIIGHAVGVRAGGKFVLTMRRLRVSGLMKDLPDQLDVDITDMKIGARIVSSDLQYDNITILEPKDSIVCAVRATRQSAATKGAGDEA